jgi:uncharacterized surface protein with fasciclin (FAS1) repeats
MKKTTFFLALLCLNPLITFNSCTPSDDDFIEVVSDPGDDTPPDDDSGDGSGNDDGSGDGSGNDDGSGDGSGNDEGDGDGGTDDEETSTDQTLTAFFKANSDYSILSTAIEQIGFSAALDNPSSYTFFAPDDAAFTRYLQTLGINDVRNISTGLLTQIIQYHMLSGRRKLSELNTGYTVALAKEFSSQGNVHMYIDKNGNTIRINDTAEITTGNIQATNGTIHKVSEVLALPSIATFILADPQFDKLAVAASRDTNDKVFELLSTLDSDFTFLAANNEAFDDVLNELGYQSINELPEATMVNILDNHIHLNSIKRQNKLTNNLMMLMKNNNSVTVTNTNGTEFTDENQRRSKLLTANIQAWNGVIHVVDKVLLPKP